MSRKTADPGNREKALVALAAAMGAGCRHCADRLHPMALSAGATTEEIACALQEGLAVRENATAIMRRKAESLLGRRIAPAASTCPGEGAPLGRLTRLAAAVAANAAPDAVRHLEGAAFDGVSDAGIEVVMGIARKVRGKAQMFSDEEIAEHRKKQRDRGEGERPEAAADAGDSDPMEACCGGPNQAEAELCTCD